MGTPFWQFDTGTENQGFSIIIFNNNVTHTTCTTKATTPLAFFPIFSNTRIRGRWVGAGADRHWVPAPTEKRGHKKKKKKNNQLTDKQRHTFALRYW